MQSHLTTLSDAIAQLSECAPHVIGSVPLWTLTNRSSGFEVIVHLPEEYAELDGVSTANDVSWIIFEGPDPLATFNNAIAELDKLNARLATPNTVAA